MGREKRRDEGFLSTRESAPGYQFSLDHCQTVKRMLAPEWTQKRLFIIIVSNRRTASPEFFSCARTRPLLSRHTCQVRSPRLWEQGKLLLSTFLARNEGIADYSGKSFWCYQQDHSNLQGENSVSDRSQGFVNTVAEILGSTTATAAKTSPLNWNCVSSNYVAFIPVPRKCQI